MIADTDIVDTLRFVEVRQQSPQWAVFLGERQVARVTERYIATPPFVVTLIDVNREDVDESKHEDRDGVMAAIVAFVRSIDTESKL